MRCLTRYEAVLPSKHTSKMVKLKRFDDNIDRQFRILPLSRINRLHMTCATQYTLLLQQVGRLIRHVIYSSEKKNIESCRYPQFSARLRHQLDAVCLTAQFSGSLEQDAGRVFPLFLALVSTLGFPAGATPAPSGYHASAPLRRPFGWVFVALSVTLSHSSILRTYDDFDRLALRELPRLFYDVVGRSSDGGPAKVRSKSVGWSSVERFSSV
jgi:hypothetical protein